MASGAVLPAGGAARSPRSWLARTPQHRRRRTRSGRLEEPRVSRSQPWRCGERLLIKRRCYRAYTRRALRTAPRGHSVRTLRPHARPQTQARSRGRIFAARCIDLPRAYGAQARRVAAGTGVRGVAEPEAPPPSGSKLSQVVVRVVDTPSAASRPRTSFQATRDRLPETTDSATARACSARTTRALSASNDDGRVPFSCWGFCSGVGADPRDQAHLSGPRSAANLTSGRLYQPHFNRPRPDSGAPSLYQRYPRWHSISWGFQRSPISRWSPGGSVSSLAIKEALAVRSGMASRMPRWVHIVLRCSSIRQSTISGSFGDALMVSSIWSFARPRPRPTGTSTAVASGRSPSGLLPGRRISARRRRSRTGAITS